MKENENLSMRWQSQKKKAIMTQWKNSLVSYTQFMVGAVHHITADNTKGVKVMTTLAEARAYAKNRKKNNPEVTQYIMENGYDYNVAYGREDMKYGKELGYRVVEII